MTLFFIDILNHGVSTDVASFCFFLWAPRGDTALVITCLIHCCVYSSFLSLGKTGLNKVWRSDAVLAVIRA
jgi:hypothetical protein